MSSQIGRVGAIRAWAERIPAILMHRARSGALLIDVLAIAVLVFLVRRAGSGIDLSFDNFDGATYHLPFAARLAGMCDKTCYDLGTWFEGHYEGLPLAAEFLQGLLWRLTGSAAGASFMNLAALALMALFLWRSFAAPPTLSFIALLAIPIVQIHATSLYIDVISNVALTIFILSVFDAISAPTRFSLDKWAILAAAVIFAGNAKMQTWPTIAVTGTVFFVWIVFAKDQTLGRFKLDGRAKLVISSFLVLIAVASAGTAIKNFVVHGNPVYPFALTVAGVEFPGPFPSDEPGKIGNAWVTAPPAARFAASVLELGGYSPRIGNWTIDGGGAGTLQTQINWRMGGFFGVYVLLCVVFLIAALAGKSLKERAGVIGGVVGLTALLCFLPHNFELRYYMFWMIGLVSLTLIYCAGNRSAPDAGQFGNAARWSFVAVFAAVVAITQGAHIFTPLTPVAQAVREAGATDFVRTHVTSGEVVCVTAIARRNTFYAPPFHQVGDYQLIFSPANPRCDEVVP